MRMFGGNVSQLVLSFMSASRSYCAMLLVMAPSKLKLKNPATNRLGEPVSARQRARSCSMSLGRPGRMP